MTRVANFYTACMRNEMHPGFVADMAREAGYGLEGLGALISAYGRQGALGTASLLFLRSLAIGHFRDDVPTGKFAITHLKQIGAIFAIHIGIGLLGRSVTDIGKWMQARETQCAVGHGLGG